MDSISSIFVHYIHNIEPIMLA